MNAARVEVSDRWLSRFVVRVQDQDGAATWGTGVLVAPGWVLTCAHVVADAPLVRVVPHRLSGHPSGTGTGDVDVPEFVRATVRARSALRPASSSSAFWPFPDLALLELDGWDEHLCAPLVDREPARSSRPHAWGFARREPDAEGVPSVGSAAEFTYVGLDGDGYLSLAAGEAPPGLSGAPLVCPTLRGVVGLVSVSRDIRDDRGGWAAPIGGLLEPAGLSDRTGPEGAERAPSGPLGHDVFTLNRNVAWRNRDAWATALPVPGAEDFVDRPWREAIIRPGTAQPSTMLRPEFRVVPYLFRGDQLQAATEWCSGPERISVRYVSAAGGAGKTRFAVQTCIQQQERGWIAGELPINDRGADAVPAPRLLVVDYVEERDATALSARLEALDRSASVMAPVRILLLSRPSVAAIASQNLRPLLEQASGATLTVLEDAVDSSAAAQALTLTQRHTLFEQALAAFGTTWHDPGWNPPEQRTVHLSAPRYARPLDVLFEAFDAALSGPGWQPDGRPPVQRALAHEIRYWRAGMPQIEAEFPRLLERCVALATLAGAKDDGEVDALFDLLAEVAPESAIGIRRRLHTWLRHLYEGPDLWNPLRPDRLGEALVARVLSAKQDHLSDEDTPDRLLAGVLSLSSDSQVERALEVLVRLAVDDQVATLAAAELAEQYAALVQRCADQTRGTSARPGRTGLLDGLSRAHNALFTSARVNSLPQGVQAQISWAADTLGTFAREHGRGSEAWAIFTTALEIGERKLELEPGNTTYRRDLSISYNKLADLALAAGRSGDAEALYRQALGVAEELTELEPGNTTYRRDLSISYNKLADLALAAGRSGDAEALYRQALGVAEELTELEPGNTTYRRDLSISYERLGDLALAAGRSGDAEALYRQALGVAEELTELEPGNTTYRRDLSISYERLGDLALAAGRSGDAEALYRQALGVREELTELEPGNTTYRRDLSISYERLGDLALAAGRSGDAEALYRQALGVREELTELEPGNTTYRRDLSISYNKLADLALAAGRSGDAEALYRQALGVREELTELEPGNTTYRRDLSISYERLGDLALAAGRSGDAEALYRQALGVREELTELEPGNTTYRRDLSISYERLAGIAAEAEQLNQARDLFNVAADSRRALLRQEPRRADLAGELGVTLYLLARVTDDQTDLRDEIVQVLLDFEAAGTITKNGTALLAWARESPR